VRRKVLFLWTRAPMNETNLQHRFQAVKNSTRQMWNQFDSR
jgi:hypothetical protein